MGKGAAFVTTAVIVAAVAAGVYYAPQYMEKETVMETVPPPVVQIVRPRRTTLETTRSLIGTVQESSELSYVMPKAAGEITAVYVEEGDYVTEGQLLCSIDTRQVDSARIQVESAQLQLQDAQTNLDRMRVLYESGDISAQSYEQVESAVKAAQLQLDAAVLAYNYQQEFTQVTAPKAGKIESSSMEVRGMAGQTSSLCVISSDQEKNIAFSVTEAMLPHVSEGTGIQVEKNGSEYAGVVTEVGETVNMNTGLFDVKAEIEDADALITGSTVRIRIVSDRAVNALTVPVDAVYYQNSQPYVYTYEDGVVHETAIETGLSDDESIQVVSGLALTDRVIISWSSELYDNAPAVLEEDAAKASAEKSAADGAGADTEASAADTAGASESSDGGSESAAN